jgi:hypothetical protein
MYEAFRTFEVMDGRDVLSMGEARYRFTVIPRRKAVTWANATEGFSPAEEPSVELHEVAIRLHEAHPWQVVTHNAFDSEIPLEWFLSQLENEDA